MKVQDENPICHLSIGHMLFSVCLSHPSYSHDYNNQLLQDHIFTVYCNIMPIINSFPFFFLLFSVFKRAVILVYKENYKLKKKMVSLVSLEVVGFYDITAM